MANHWTSDKNVLRIQFAAPEFTDLPVLLEAIAAYLRDTPPVFVWHVDIAGDTDDTDRIHWTGVLYLGT